jgi:riboflavin kinase/FMN adenylyltransferase
MKRPRSVVTIGNFDGVHLGHAALIERAREEANRVGDGTRVVALAFDPHPGAVLRPGQAPARLTTFEQRAEQLGRLGADEVVRLEPTGQLLSLEPLAFLTQLCSDLAPVAIVEGQDFRFGRGRAGDISALERFATSLGFQTIVVDPVEVTLSDHTLVRASSSLARWLLERGRVHDAAQVLGRAYEIDGHVVQGDRRGRAIGYPTANIATECMIPGDGVYAGRGRLPDGSEYAAAISIGSKPQFGGAPRTLEAHLLDIGERSGECIRGLPEYGWPIRLSIEHWLRDQAAFASLPALLEQIERDCHRTREMILRKEEPSCR